MKTLLSLAALTLLVSALAFGQTTNGTSAQASARFELGDAALDVEAVDADWGVLSPGTTYTITADGQISPLTAEGAYEVEPVAWVITGGTAYGSPVQVSFTLPPFFTGDGGTGFARIPYAVTATSAGWFNEDAAPGVYYTPMDPRVPNTVYLNDGGEAYIGLGGVLSIPANVPSADVNTTYEGVFILTAAYTGF
jgi:hypothetical protein